MHALPNAAEHVNVRAASRGPTTGRRDSTPEPAAAPDVQSSVPELTAARDPSLCLAPLFCWATRGRVLAHRHAVSRSRRPPWQGAERRLPRDRSAGAAVGCRALPLSFLLAEILLEVGGASEWFPATATSSAPVRPPR